MKIERLNVRISGSGGQGVIMSGMLLGEAIAIGDGRNVSQSQTYGPEARGGATYSDVIISDGEIYFPECNYLDILVAFTYEAYEKYASIVKENGLIIADETAVDVLAGSAKTVTVPFIKVASGKYKRPIMANMISLGFISAYTMIVNHLSLRSVIKEQFADSKHLELNLKGFSEGCKIGTDYLNQEKS